MKKKLSVKNLVVSFRTPAGKVQAVRNISFDLHEGETLAVVGESGSGKSVTSKAILGILAGNSIIEGGSIIYDGMDLLKITEDDFYRIRGDKIAMIFQDPLSSLNPIMRIGNQLTEAMLLKGEARQKSCKEAFNSTLTLLGDEIVAVENNASLKELCTNFDKFEFKHIELESAYNVAKESAVEVVDEIEDVLFYIEKDAFKDPKYTLEEISRLAAATANEYVVSGADADKVKALSDELKKAAGDDVRKKDYTNSARIITEIQNIVKPALEKETPDFFSMGYFLTFSGKALPEMPVADLNEYLVNFMNENFMDDFKSHVVKALENSAKKHMELKAEAVKVVEANRAVLEADNMDKKACDTAMDAMIKAVDASIDKLEIRKDGVAYTFGSTIKAAVKTYFEGIPKNEKAAKLHEKQQKKYDRLVAKGKTPTWKVTPSTAVDLEVAKATITAALDRLVEHYNELLAGGETRDFMTEAEELIAFFKENASGSVHKVTKEMAKHRAIKLMEEVGISDARTRYNQYPFEFSGGMRQRIVIAIALAADPDILICDEPTTALDVTIQAQILELINKLKKDRNLSIIFITHDLGVVANMADRIAVMYAGKIVETGTSEDIFYSPAHPYTWALLSAMPDLETEERLEAIPGTPPNMIYPPVGDAFADRNKYAMQIDFEMQPPEFKISDTHSASTWLLHPDAPKVEIPQIIQNRIARMKAKGGASNE